MARQRSIAIIALTIAAAIWGSTFIAQIEAARAGVAPNTFVSVRFFLGAAVVLLCAPLFRISLTELLTFRRDTIVLGALIWIGSFLQQVGMETTSAAKGGFITGLYILGVPLIARGIFKKPVSGTIWVSGGLSCVGLWLLCGMQGEHFIDGDLWILACAVVFSLHVALTSEAVADKSGFAVSFQQNIVAAFISLIAATLLGEPLRVLTSAGPWIPILYAGILSSGIAFTIQAVVQKYLSSSLTALILGLESVFAAIAGYLLLAEILSFQQIFGAILMFCGTSLAVFAQSESAANLPESNSRTL